MARQIKRNGYHVFVGPLFLPEDAEEIAALREKYTREGRKFAVTNERAGHGAGEVREDGIYLWLKPKAPPPSKKLVIDWLTIDWSPGITAIATSLGCARKTVINARAKYAPDQFKSKRRRKRKAIEPTSKPTGIKVAKWIKDKLAQFKP